MQGMFTDNIILTVKKLGLVRPSNECVTTAGERQGPRVCAGRWSERPAGADVSGGLRTRRAEQAPREPLSSLTAPLLHAGFHHGTSPV